VPKRSSSHFFHRVCATLVDGERVGKHAVLHGLTLFDEVPRFVDFTTVEVANEIARRSRHVHACGQVEIEALEGDDDRHAKKAQQEPHDPLCAKTGQLGEQLNERHT
jgi:hypothetical protein